MAAILKSATSEQFASFVRHSQIDNNNRLKIHEDNFNQVDLKVYVGDSVLRSLMWFIISSTRS